MINPAPTATWLPKATQTQSVRAAFAALAPGQQRLLEALVFDGETCTRIAQVTGGSATEVRQRAGAALLELRAALAPGAPGGAVATMLVLRALDALDPDEDELVDLMLLHQPTLQRTYEDYLELVGELCLLAPRTAPSGDALARLRAALDDDGATN